MFQPLLCPRMFHAARIWIPNLYFPSHLHFLLCLAKISWFITSTVPQTHFFLFHNNLSFKSTQQTRFLCFRTWYFSVLACMLPKNEAVWYCTPQHEQQVQHSQQSLLRHLLHGSLSSFLIDNILSLYHSLKTLCDSPFSLTHRTWV